MRVLRIILSLCLCYNAEAQIPNAGFENWHPVVEALGAEDPDGWESNNLICDSASGFPITKSTIAHSGQYAVQIKPNYQYQKFGIISLGQIEVDTLGNGSFFEVNIECSGDSLNKAPFILAGYYQYIGSLSSEKKAHVMVGLKSRDCHLFNHPASGSGILRTTSASNSNPPTIHDYQPFAIALSLAWNDSLPLIKGIQITFSYDDVDSTVGPGSFLLIDDLSLHGNLLSLPSKNLNTLVSLYPNPAREILHLEKPEFLEPENVAVYNIRGEKVYESPAWISEINLSSWQSGLYVFRMQTRAGTISKKIRVQ